MGAFHEMDLKDVHLHGRTYTSNELNRSLDRVGFC
jgi:hypothetical protein